MHVYVAVDSGAVVYAPALQLTTPVQKSPRSAVSSVAMASDVTSRA